jgi:hypothetical protein
VFHAQKDDLEMNVIIIVQGFCLLMNWVATRTKLKQMEMDCEVLKRCCENLSEKNWRL